MLGQNALSVTKSYTYIGHIITDNLCDEPDIYATKIDVVVCPPNISETVAGRLIKVAHSPRIASTMIKLISKPIVLPILLILVKTIQRIVADPKRKLSPPFDSADSVPSLGHPAPVREKCYLALRQQLLPEPRSAWTGSETIHTVPSHALNASLLYTRLLHVANVMC